MVLITQRTLLNLLIENNMKTYTQDQYDKAKLRAYKKGYQEASELISMDETLENSNDIKEWKKWEQFDFDWSVTLLVVACVGAILMMIF